MKKHLDHVGRRAAVAGCCSVMAALANAGAAEFPGARLVSERGYSGCVELRNATTRVVLEPNLGGRVLGYALDGVEALYQDPKFDGATRDTPGRAALIPGGRFDVGPESVLPPRPDLWLGRWRAETTGERAARLTSEVDRTTGLQLVREFRLARSSSHLACTQTIVNRGAAPRVVCHWSRTLAEGGGICIVPLNPASRYPQGYLTYGPNATLLFRPPPEPNVVSRDGVLLILGPPTHKKFAIDVSEGWLAYLTRPGLLFIKRFPVYPDRAYAELAANAVSIWYSEERACEVEPIGPMETLPPGGRAAFTEEWWLQPFAFPPDRAALDIAAVRRAVASVRKDTSP